MNMERKKVLSIKEVISTERSWYKIIQDDVQTKISREKEKKNRLCFPITYGEFADLFITFGTYCLLRNNRNGNFILDEYNEPVILQLYLYFTNDSAFCGDLYKGVMLQGKFGCGKTLIFETFSLIHNYFIQKFHWRVPLLTFIKSVTLQENIEKHSIQQYTQRPLIIDEFGRESKTIQNYGNITRPISELLSIRSDIGVVTHGTTNFTFQTLSSDDFYGGMIGDRLKSMFNFIELKGDSKRQ